MWIFLSFETLLFISAYFYSGSPKGVERLSCLLFTWRASLVSLEVVFVRWRYSFLKKTSLRLVIIKSHCRCPPREVSHKVCGCFIITGTQLPLGFMATVRWLLSMLCVLSIGLQYPHVLVFSCWRRTCFNGEGWPNVLEICMDPSEILNFISKLWVPQLLWYRFLSSWDQVCLYSSSCASSYSQLDLCADGDGFQWDACGIRNKMAEVVLRQIQEHEWTEAGSS